MPTFKGYNTIGQHKKFGLVDFELIKRDLLNAFLTRSGEIAGRPDLGTNIWNYVFEPSVIEVRNAIENEVRRIINSDPRTTLEKIDLTYNHNTVIIETAIIISPNVSPQKLILQSNKDVETLYIT